MPHWNMVAGWAGMVLGLVAGAAIGMFIHRESFAGGYGSYRRRMMRLGHVAFFALGIINVLFALMLTATQVVLSYPRLASLSLIAGAALMPVVCYLTAWKTPFRHAFALPVICVAVALALMLQGVVML